MLSSVKCQASSVKCQVSTVDNRINTGRFVPRCQVQKYNHTRCTEWQFRHSSSSPKILLVQVLHRCWSRFLNTFVTIQNQFALVVARSTNTYWAPYNDRHRAETVWWEQNDSAHFAAQSQSLEFIRSILEQSSECQLECLRYHSNLYVLFMQKPI